MEFMLKTAKLKNLLSGVNTEKGMLYLSLAVVLIANIHILFTLFLSDDFLHLYQIANWNPLEFIFSSIGGHLYIVRNLIFYCMFKLFGMNSVAFFSIVLLTHLGCSYILYKIIYLLTGKATLAAAGLIIWGISPANYPALSWYSAYGHLLVGFFFLLLLYDLFRIEKKTIVFSGNTVIRWSIYLFMMAASYGIGLAIVCLSPFAIVIILWKNNKKWKIASSMLPAIALILFLFIFKDAIYYYFSGIISESKAALLSVPLRVALSNFKIILRLFIFQCALNIYHLVAFPLLLVPVTILRLCPNFLNPIFVALHYPFYAAIYSVIAIPVVILFIIVFSRSHQYRRHYAGLGIFFFGLTGMITYTHGATNDISVFLVFDMRFLYITLMVVLIMLTLMADEFLDIFPKILKTTRVFVFIVIAISIYSSVHLSKIMDIGNGYLSEQDGEIYYDTIADIEKAIRAHPTGSSVFIDNTLNENFSLYPTLRFEFPGKAAIFAITYPSNTFEGRHVYFVEKDCHVADKHTKKKHWRTSSLIVSACDRNKSN
jgi:hypothetical protein